MQPTLLSPAPVAVFADGVLAVTARYNSGSGAPMEGCSIGARTSGASVAATSVTVDGETFGGSIALADVTHVDPGWSLGQDITIELGTMERGAWSRTSATEKTCGEPVVTLVSGTSGVTGFPHAIEWEYADYDGFYQNRYDLRVSGSRLMGEVSIGAYSTAHRVEIEGPEIAYAADFGETAETLSCSLRVTSTSGAGSTVEFDLPVAACAQEASVDASFDDGRVLVESDAAFELFALGRTCRRAAYTETGTLMFDLPDPSTRLFAVTLDDALIGTATELATATQLTASYLDYIADGQRKRVEVLVDAAESSDTSEDSDYVVYAGRSDPTVHGRGTTKTMSAGAYMPAGVDIYGVQDELRGIDGVYRSIKGGIFRVHVDSASVDACRHGGGAGTLSVGMTVVDGSPYELLYGSPLYVDEMLYPEGVLYPDGCLYAGRQRRRAEQWTI